MESVTGCDRVAAGRDNCYALTLAKRLKGMGAEKYQNDGDPRTSGPGFGVTIHPFALNQPHKWRSPKVVFVNSMSDPPLGVPVAAWASDPAICRGVTKGVLQQCWIATETSG